MALHITVHTRITAKIVRDTFRETAAQHGHPASTLTDYGMAYTVRLAGARTQGGRTSFEHELRRLGIVQKNSRPNHPTTDRSSDTHDRVRHDLIDRHGKLTLRVNGRLHHIGIGRTHARTPVIMLIHDLLLQHPHGLVHASGCPWADHLNDPPAAPLGLLAPRPDKVGQSRAAKQKIEYLGFDPLYRGPRATSC